MSFEVQPKFVLFYPATLKDLTDGEWSAISVDGQIVYELKTIDSINDCE